MIVTKWEMQEVNLRVASGYMLAQLDKGWEPVQVVGLKLLMKRPLEIKTWQMLEGGKEVTTTTTVAWDPK